MYQYIKCINTLNVSVHWMYQYIKCINTLNVSVHWMYQHIECISTLNVSLHWIYQYIECISTLNASVYWIPEFWLFWSFSVTNMTPVFSPPYMYVIMSMEWNGEMDKTLSTHWKIRSAYRILVRKSCEKRLPGRKRRWWWHRTYRIRRSTKIWRVYILKQTYRKLLLRCNGHF